jgi:hypothetical protein
VSRLTVQTVLDFALVEVASLAARLRAEGETIERVAAGMPSLDASWRGFASEAASGRLAELRLSTELLADIVAGCTRVLSAAVVALEPARDALDRAMRAAADAGLTLLDDGSVSLPFVDGTAASPGDGGRAALAAEQARIGLAVRTLATAALAAAQEADADAAAALRGCVQRCVPAFGDRAPGPASRPRLPARASGQPDRYLHPRRHSKSRPGGRCFRRRPAPR